MNQSDFRTTHLSHNRKRGNRHETRDSFPIEHRGGREAEVHDALEVEDAAKGDAVKGFFDTLEDGPTDVFGESFEVTSVANVVITRPAPSPPPADEACDCNAADASDECKEACGLLGAALGLTGVALILVIALPIVGCCLLTLCIVLLVCCCCKGSSKRRASLSTAKRHQQYAVDMATPSAAMTTFDAPTGTFSKV